MSRPLRLMAVKIPSVEWRVSRTGLTVMISNGIARDVVIPLSSRPVADDIVTRVHFWIKAQPTWTPEEVMVRALVERDCVVHAQARRRFRRVFQS